MMWENFYKLCEERRKMDYLMQIENKINMLEDISSSNIEKFFRWFSFASRAFDFYTEDTMHVYRHRKIQEVSFNYENEIACSSILVEDTDNQDKKEIIKIYCYEDAMDILTVKTFSNFEKEYVLKRKKLFTINKKDLPFVYFIIKDFMKKCILRRLTYDLFIGGNCNVDETIPDSIFGI